MINCKLITELFEVGRSTITEHINGILNSGELEENSPLKKTTKILKEYMIKGIVMDDERLKNPNYIFGEDYFELIDIIYDIDKSNIKIELKNI